ncbi:MAG: TIGR03435 family protein [Bryobacteraceae bacterium]|jgi:uncharacterized protein (TIGR03435 family)
MVASAAPAQIKAPTDKKFDVVSVKPDSPGDIPGGCAFSRATFSSPVEFIVEQCSLTTLINYAYGPFADQRIAGVPKWANSAWYSVSAKSASPVSIGEKYAMLQPVMEERFKLKWHLETRQLPVYYLSVNGAIKLQQTVPGSCRTWDPKDGPPNPDPKQPPVCGLWMNRVLPDGGRTLEANGVPMAQLASTVGRLLGRQGMDSTGSRDLFDIHLEYATPELGSAGESAGGTAARLSAALGGPARQAPATASEPSGLPSIFTALKKVGLTVKAGRGPVEVFVVDSVQRASEN